MQVGGHHLAGRAYGRDLMAIAGQPSPRCVLRPSPAPSTEPELHGSPLIALAFRMLQALCIVPEVCSANDNIALFVPGEGTLA